MHIASNTIVSAGAATEQGDAKPDDQFQALLIRSFCCYIAKASLRGRERSYEKFKLRAANLPQQK
jgi:hypothetical protein